MPYMIISCEFKMETGPTYVGDGLSDAALMAELEAKIIKDPVKSNSIKYSTQWAPRCVLNFLEKKGWQVITSAGVGQSCIWTLYSKD
ncbi:GTP cyclohydrolase 1 feedback regulatory protein-like [Homarus americanus]|uniref:GTP cyclohydrolase 1 feedback regulatory protein-like n=1 Tax=Homarus americanus TaxID=6706 RepID=UPI001C4923B5|nr:GTP cyclohydrolase 1 feedback regulatory protein-like [Homarus americanus]